MEGRQSTVALTLNRDFSFAFYTNEKREREILNTRYTRETYVSKNAIYVCHVNVPRERERENPEGDREKDGETTKRRCGSHRQTYVVPSFPGNSLQSS